MRCPDTQMADQVRFSFTCCSAGCEFDVSCGLREVTLGVTAVAGHVKAAGHALCDFPPFILCMLPSHL